MKRFFLLSLFFVGFLSMNMAVAQTSSAIDDCKKNINVTVKGLVCDFCARSLEKVFNKRKEVEGIEVNLDDGLVKIKLNDAQLIDDKTVKKLIKNAGYSVVDIELACQA